MKINFVDIEKHLSKIELQYITIDELKELREKTKLTHVLSQCIMNGYLECYVQQDWNCKRMIPYEHQDEKKTYFYVKSDNVIEFD